MISRGCHLKVSHGLTFLILAVVETRTIILVLETLKISLQFFFSAAKTNILLLDTILYLPYISFYKKIFQNVNMSVSNLYKLFFEI